MIARAVLAAGPRLRRRRRPAQETPRAAPGAAPAVAGAPSSAARERWEKLSPSEKDVLRKRWQTFQEMTPERQAELKSRLDRWRSLPPATSGPRSPRPGTASASSRPTSGGRCCSSSAGTAR